jgi:hypothetical protein
MAVGRYDWTFQMTQAEVLEGAKAKHKMHGERYEFWTGKLAEVTSELRAYGLEISDPMADLVRSIKASSYGGGVSVKVKPEWTEKLRQAQEKVMDHRKHHQFYGAWVACLSIGDGSRLLDLRQDDWSFFFGN